MLTKICGNNLRLSTRPEQGPWRRSVHLEHPLVQNKAPEKIHPPGTSTRPEQGPGEDPSTHHPLLPACLPSHLFIHSHANLLSMQTSYKPTRVGQALTEHLQCAQYCASCCFPRSASFTLLLFLSSQKPSSLAVRVHLAPRVPRETKVRSVSWRSQRPVSSAHLPGGQSI